MKDFIKEFCKRGLIAAWGGPLVMAIVFFILGKTGVVSSLTVDEAVLGIFTSTLLAFIAGGISCIYGVERLPLFHAIIIHAIVLYLDYLLIYLLNGWLKNALVPVAIFSVSFIVGYAIIWGIVYLIIKKNTQRLNEKLNRVQN